MNRLLHWLDHRTGYKEFLHEALYESVPGGARWRYVWGSTLAFAFTVQLITGLFLWMFYSPSAQTAWESVFYIQYKLPGGFFLRGLHHYMAQFMVVLMAIHLFQVVIDGAYKAPREINFWLGLILMKIVLGLALTGYLLPWDQKGYYATQVATKITGIVPFVGPQLQQLVVGGSEYGHHTLTRFFALHAGLLPAALIFFLVLHIALFRRHGLTAKIKPGKPDQMFWPDQILKDAVACLAVILLVSFLAWRFPAELTSPADPADSYDARPEWYFLFLFQFLKFFHGATGELIGAIVVPGMVMGVLFLMPFIAKIKFGHKLNVAFLFVLLVGAGVLTGMAIYEDKHNLEYQGAVAQAHEDAERAIELASEGIPKTGALDLVQGDAKIQGGKLFRRHCASCHDHVDSEGHGITQPRELVFTPGQDGKVAPEAKPDPTGAPNLYGFANRDWLTGFLNPEKIAAIHFDAEAKPDAKGKRFIDPNSAPYFGNTSHRDGDMVNFVKDDLSALDNEGKKKLEEIIIALSAEAKLKSQIELDQHAERNGVIARGQANMTEAITNLACTDCHKFHDNDPGSADTPDLTGYGSREWLLEFIGNPNHARFYGENNDRMPAFHDTPDAPAQNLVSQEDLQMIVDWLRGEWYEPKPKEVAGQ